MSNRYRVFQQDIGETAPVVLETARRAVTETEDGNVRVSLIHEEEPHWNLGYNGKELPDVPLELQDHRYCGGEGVLHDNTICMMRGTEKAGPKVDVDRERRSFAAECLDAFENVGEYEHTTFLENGGIRDPETGQAHFSFAEEAELAYYDSSDGDIYVAEDPENPNPLIDPQVIALGTTDLEIEVNGQEHYVVIGRACIYGELPEAYETYPEEAEGFKSWDQFLEGIETVENADEIQKELEDGRPRIEDASNFAEDSFPEARNDIESREWELRNGKGRRSGSCF